MIFRINRATYKAGLSEEQHRAGLEMLRRSGAANPAVKSYVVGPEFGGESEYGAVCVAEGLDGYWAYLTIRYMCARSWRASRSSRSSRPSTSRIPMIRSSARRSPCCSRIRWLVIARRQTPTERHAHEDHR